MQLKKLAAVGAASALLGFCFQAAAEKLVYVTPSVIGNIDSSNPSADSSTNGPISYTLPAGFSGFEVVGATTAPRDVPATIFLLARSGSTCQLFSVNPASASGGAVKAAADGGSYSCNSSVNDFALFDSGNAGSDSTQNQEYLAPGGSSLFDVNPAVSADGGLKQTLSIKTSSGNAGNVVALAVNDPADSPTIYGIDANSVTLFASGDSNVGSGTLTEANNQPLGATLVSPVSLTYSSASSQLYLLTAGHLYSISGTAAADLIGAVPSGTLSVKASSIQITGGGSSSSSSSGGSSGGSSSSSSGGSSSGSSSSSGGSSTGTDSGSGGGAFAPFAALPLLALAAVRRRRKAKN